EKRYTSRMGFVQPAPQEALEEQANGNSAASQQANAVYYNGTFAVDNAQRELKTSMTAQVFVRVAEAKNVLRVPVSTLGRALSTDSYLITVLENGKPQQRKIRIGINDRQFAQVLEGLQLGDRVVMPADGAQG
ncbi:MAG: efflux RND transporter periplasmic adaptor subunit, partial [Enterobacterales bacterium]|nr:efflux RND transporter periplasmic adaptor subunit [Enterobacterales bacterium]